MPSIYLQDAYVYEVKRKRELERGAGRSRENMLNVIFKYSSSSVALPTFTVADLIIEMRPLYLGRHKTTAEILGVQSSGEM